MLVGSQDGGAETFFTRLGPALHKRGMRQHMVISPHAGREAAFKACGLPYSVVDFESWFGLKGRWRLRRILRTERPDVIVAWMNRAARRLPKGRFRTVGRLGGKYKLKHYDRCDRLIVNSRPLLDYVQTHGWPDATLIANFVAPETAAPLHEKPRNKPLLLTSGRLHRQKGFNNLVEAMQSIDAELWIAGEGEERSHLEASIRQWNLEHKIKLLGWRQDMAALLATADMFVFPSTFEGTSNALLEAMFHAKPIVTTDGEGVSWFLTHDEDALIVPTGNAKALSEAVNALLSDRQRASRLAANAKATYEREFSEDAICRQWIKFFEVV